MKWYRASCGVAGDHFCQAASTIISGVTLWLACLNRVRIERMLVLLPCLVSTMPAMLLLAHHINAVLKG